MSERKVAGRWAQTKRNKLLNMSLFGFDRSVLRRRVSQTWKLNWAEQLRQRHNSREVKTRWAGTSIQTFRTESRTALRMIVASLYKNTRYQVISILYPNPRSFNCSAPRKQRDPGSEYHNLGVSTLLKFSKEVWKNMNVAETENLNHLNNWNH